MAVVAVFPSWSLGTRGKGSSSGRHERQPDSSAVEQDDMVGKWLWWLYSQAGAWEQEEKGSSSGRHERQEDSSAVGRVGVWSKVR